VEAAVVVGVFLVIIFGLLDLGLLVLHHNMLAEGARRLAREAIVHGAKTEQIADQWGPATLNGTAGDNSSRGAVLLPVMVAVKPNEVSYTIEWPDGDNEPDHRVRVTLNYQHEMMIPFLFGSGIMNLNSVSTMRVAH
jgi:hypothetical protein